MSISFLIEYLINRVSDFVLQLGHVEESTSHRVKTKNGFKEDYLTEIRRDGVETTVQYVAAHNGF